MSDRDFDFEPIPGLPGIPPKGETVLWQGRPVTLALAREAMGLNWIAGYFVLLALWRGGAALADHTLAAAVLIALPHLGVGLIVCALVLFAARVMARATMYTITSSRVVLRIGAALPVTFNVPFAQIASASLDLRRSGTGTIALATLGDVRIAWAIAWPHVRPWHFRRTEPALRCIPDAERVAGILAEAAETRISQPTVAPRPDGLTVAAE
jgi:hypothetical protein